MPKQPDYDHFLVLTAAPKPNAADEYSYVFAEALPGTDDFRHVVYEEPDRVKSFHFDGVSVPPVVKQKLRSISAVRLASGPTHASRRS